MNPNVIEIKEVDLEKSSEHEIETAVKKMKKDKNYSGLGWFFWEAFLILENGKRREFIKKLYNSFSKKEKSLMEQV